MVNHVRTLLLNMTGSPGDGYPGEEYVPSGYAAKALPAYLQSLRRIVFGGQPDRAMMNWRLREITSLFYNTELQEFVTALDPRITYLPPRQDLFDLALQPPAVTPLGETTASLALIGANPPLQNSEQLLISWTITVVDSSNVSVTDGFGNSVVYSYIMTGGNSSLVPLGNGLAVRFTTASPGSCWSVTYLCRPIRSLLDVLADLSILLTESVRASLFGLNASEPMQTFQNLYSQNPQPAYQLAGVLMAMAYAADTVMTLAPNTGPSGLSLDFSNRLNSSYLTLLNEIWVM